MMMNKTKLLLAATACAVVATAAVAHNHGPRAERMIERMDTDGDGRVTREDARAFAATRFARLDTNGDGQVTRDERRDARGNRGTRRGERMARMDMNGDGMISRDEMRAVAGDRAERRFTRLDSNGDGLVTLAEITEMRGQRGERRQKRGKGERAGGRGPVTQAAMEERVLKRFARLDTDGDGVITLAEVRSR